MDSVRSISASLAQIKHDTPGLDASAKDHRDPRIAGPLADIVYVAYGTAVTYGIDLDMVLAGVHRSNMSKLGT